MLRQPADERLGRGHPRFELRKERRCRRHEPARSRRRDPRAAGGPRASRVGRGGSPAAWPRRWTGPPRSRRVRGSARARGSSRPRSTMAVARNARTKPASAASAGRRRAHRATRLDRTETRDGDRLAAPQPARGRPRTPPWSGSAGRVRGASALARTASRSREIFGARLRRAAASSSRTFLHEGGTSRRDERRPAGHELEEHRAERVHVRSRVGVAREALGREIGERAGRPARVPRAGVSSRKRETPKSRTTHDPSAATSRFCGFRSPWTTPAAWAAATIRATSSTMRDRFGFSRAAARDRASSLRRTTSR